MPQQTEHSNLARSYISCSVDGRTRIAANRKALAVTSTNGAGSAAMSLAALEHACLSVAL